MKRMIVIIMLAFILVIAGMTDTATVAVGNTVLNSEEITSLYATERAIGYDNYGRHFMYLIREEDLSSVKYLEITELIDNCDGWNGLNLYGNKNGIIGVFWAEDDTNNTFYESGDENEKTQIQDAFVESGELKYEWVLEGASLGNVDKYAAFYPVRIVQLVGEYNYRLVVIGKGKNIPATSDVPTKVTPTPVPSKKPIVTPAPTLRPTEEPTVTPAPTLRPTTEIVTATPAPELQPTSGTVTAAPAPELQPTLGTVTATPIPELQPTTETATVTPVPELQPISETITTTPVPELQVTIEDANQTFQRIEDIAEAEIYVDVSGATDANVLENGQQLDFD